MSAPAAASSAATGSSSAAELEAVAALTAIAERSVPRPGASPSSAADGPDFAGVLGAVLATVAANVGGVEVLLAGRSGSWEAGLVGELVNGTLGHDPDETELLRWRTAPVVLRLDPEDVFADLGLGTVRWEDHDAASEAASAFDESLPHTDPPSFDVDMAEEESEALWAVADRIDELWDADVAAYGVAYEQVVRAQVTAWGCEDLPVTVQVVRYPERGDEVGTYVGLVDHLHQIARTRTPLPATGRPPLWGGQDVAALRAAGLGYLDRARADSAGQPS